MLTRNNATTTCTSKSVRPKRRRLYRWLLISAAGVFLLAVNYLAAYGAYTWYDYCAGLRGGRLPTILRTVFYLPDTYVYSNRPGARLLTTWHLWCAQHGEGSVITWRECAESVEEYYCVRYPDVNSGRGDHR